MRKKFLVISCFIAVIPFITLYLKPSPQTLQVYDITEENMVSIIDKEINSEASNLHPLSIEYMRLQEYPGSDLKIEENLSNGSNYTRHRVSYFSEGLKQYALLTIPQGEKPASGWPAIIFNHGYIPPKEYKTTERYVAYTNAFSSNGYILLRPDYRGHDQSEGNPTGAYYSPGYTIDVLNALASLKKLPEVDTSKIGMWGHSMGGSITLRSMVTVSDIKAGVIWGGVVADYYDMANNWRRARPFTPTQSERTFPRPTRQELISQYGEITNDSPFWHSISPIHNLQYLSGPIQIQHGTSDEEVPLLFGERLDEALTKQEVEHEFIPWQGDDHNLSLNLYSALQKSVEFFNKYLK